MVKPSSAPMAPSTLRAARRELLETGHLSLVWPDPGLGRSWLRSHALGLSPVGRPPGAPHASSAQLRQALERQHELVAHARPVMQDLFAQTRDSDGLVLLSDGQGLLLQAMGDGRFVERAQRVALRPGAIWDERWRGTNAIGTALVERRPVAVLGGEHYLERNGFLSCTAAPIRDPQGRVLGVLDISADQRGFHRHTLALVKMAARVVEQRLFDTRHADALRLRLHPQREGLGTPAEGLLAVSEDGWIVGANEAALGWLGADAVRSLRLESVLPVAWDDLLGWACGTDQPPRLMRRDGEPGAFWLRADVPTGWRRRGIALIGHPRGDRPSSRLGAPTAQETTVPVTPMPDEVAKAADPVIAKAVTSVGSAIALVPSADAPQPSAAVIRDDVTPMRAPLDPADALSELDLGDPALHQVLWRLRKVLDKPIALLLQGESGVGKDVLARAMHDSGARRAGPYVAVNCAALPEGLIEAELFGYRGGAFTGAAREGAPGRLRQAHGGTLFLDEIGDMPMTMQARLLRVLQDRQVQPLGGGATVTVDLQLICASHRPLKDLVAQGRFREDLYYRINGLTLTVPPLRARTDLPQLTARLLAALAPDRSVTVAPEVTERLRAYGWPGNIRQLEQALRVAVAMLESDEAEIQMAHLPEDLQAALDEAPAAPPFGLSATDTAPSGEGGAPASASPAAIPGIDSEPNALRDHARAHARRVMTECGGNVSEAARRLGIGRNTLYRMLR